jgi:microcin C transport system substrate-binding protein
MALLNRRHVLGLGVGALSAAQFGSAVAVEGGTETHGLSAFGNLKYPANFHHFDYVNVDAPKGGMFSQLVGSGGSTFDSLNAYIVKGDAANGMSITFASLMARAYDEPDAVYLLAADHVAVSSDGLVYRFRLRPGITFHDGTKISASDVVFSLTTLKTKGHPTFSSVLRDVAGVVAEDERTVRLSFLPTRGLDVPALAAAMPIFSEKYYTARSFSETSLEAPLGSGPYRVSRFEQGKLVEFERVRNWWGEDLPVSRGLYNFDILRDEYYRDREAGFEAFTGGNYLFREEFTSRVWATRYDFPAMRDGRVKRSVIPDERPSGAQGWLLNTRRDKFRDRNVREAMTIAFDFEWTNKNLMYGSYERTHSVFQNSEMMAKGEPSPDEVALLEPFRDRLLPEVFGPAWTPPVTDGSGQDRKLLRNAGDLLNAAGWNVKDGRRVNAKGEQLAVEFLLTERSFEPHHATFIKNLRVLGIDANIRLVDPSQAEARIKDFDFDIAIARFVYPQIPGSALRTYFSSEYVTQKGSNNLAGIADPVVDALVEKAVSARTQSELNTTCRALDRVLRSGRYWIPHWSKASFWIAYWDQFGFPATKPRYARGAPETWWSDPNKTAKAAKLEQAK